MSWDVLKVSAVSIIEEIKTEGHSPLKVLCDDSRNYIVKPFKPYLNPDFYQINEFLCNALLHFWNIPTPQCALVTLEPILLTENLSSNHKPHYYSKPCYGSLFLKNSIEILPEATFTTKPQLRRIKNAKDILKIALFDVWVMNDDRRASNPNLIYSQATNDQVLVTAIDHAFVFNSESHDVLVKSSNSFSYNTSILHHPLAQSITNKIKLNKEDIYNLRSNFYFCVKNCEKNFHLITDFLCSELKYSMDLATNLSSTLFNEDRLKQTFDIYLSIISGIK